MNVRKVVAGSVLAAGLGVAGVFGAGTASAATDPTGGGGDPVSTPKPGPGISFSANGHKAVGIGNQGTFGAQAESTKGNAALAISLGISPVGTHALASGGKGNTAFALEGVAAIITYEGERNSAVAIGGANSIVREGSDNHTFTALGISDTGLELPDSDGNVSVAVCGKSIISAQGTINTPVPGGALGIC